MKNINNHIVHPKQVEQHNEQVEKILKSKAYSIFDQLVHIVHEDELKQKNAIKLLLLRLKENKKNYMNN